mmetsp:Transcript_38923/g.86582  ORF Transcript_38923/g.86582 Transcript_38923/m.86582 type:complete len:221 (-) Transcript_38923:243-905(-)
MEHHVVLHQAMQCELGFIIHIDLLGVGHKLLADCPHVLGQSSGEHHDLLVVGCELEDLLDVRAHVKLLKHLVTLIQHKVADSVQLQRSLLGELLDPSGGANDDVGGLLLQLLLLLLHRESTEEVANLHTTQASAETLKLVADLVCKLACVAKNDSLYFVGLGVKLLEDRKNEHSGLAHTRLRLAKDIHTQNGVRDALVLNFGGMLKTAVSNSLQELWFEH